MVNWNKTHIHNPDWPPHAKFHNAQTMSLGAALSAAALTAILRAAIAATAGTVSVGGAHTCHRCP